MLATILLAAFTGAALLLVWYGVNSSVDPWRASRVAFALSVLAFPVVGWFIAVRRPQNPLGWIYLIFPIFIAFGGVSEELALGAAQAGSDVAAAILLFVSVWLNYFGFWLLFGPGLSLFPDGRFPSNRFRWALWALVALLLIVGVSSAVGPNAVCIKRAGAAVEGCFRSVENPLGLVGVESLNDAAGPLLTFVILLTLGVSTAGIVVRYLRSGSDVRQQIKWVAFVVAAAVPLLLIVFLRQDIMGLSVSEWAFTLVFMMFWVGLPVAIGVAILRYRLYDIDRIISRTAAYAVIGVVLALVYVVGVTLTQRILPIQGSSLGIVISTLVVAALFNPLRQRVQNAVDQRFYRSRYDAQRVLDTFSSKLRDDVDMEEMQAALLSAAQETMQPSYLSLWVREREPDRGSSWNRQN